MTEDNPDARPSDLDLIKINDLEVDGAVLAESGFWSVLRYPKNYTLVFHTKTHGFAMVDTETKEQAISILQKL